MRRLSAMDAIAPAFTRTHDLLFRPFKVGRSWKLAASSYVAFAGSVFVPFVVYGLALPGGLTAGQRAAVLGALSAMTLVFLGLFYLGVRMSFVQLEMVATRTVKIAPMWRRYAGRVGGWLWLKVGVGTAVTLAFAPVVVARVRSFIAYMAAHPQGAMPPVVPGQPPDAAAMQAAMGPMIAQMAGFEGTLLLVFGVLKLISTLLDDFALPAYVIERVSVAAALKEGWRIVAADPLQVVVYLVLKLVLAMIGFVVQYLSNIVVLIPVGILGVLAALVGAAVSAMVAKSGHPVSPVAMLALGVGAGVLIAAAIVAMVWWQIFTLGYLLTLLEAYGLYFVGGRYGPLGEALEPGAGAPYVYTPPPVGPGAGEDDGDPPLPMDPALA